MQRAQLFWARLSCNGDILYGGPVVRLGVQQILAPSLAP